MVSPKDLMVIDCELLELHTDLEFANSPVLKSCLKTEVSSEKDSAPTYT